MALLDIDEEQALAILNLQLRRLAALERQDDRRHVGRARDPDRRLQGHPRLARAAAADHLRRARRDHRQVRRRAAHRVILPFDGDMDVEDLIPEEEVVVTITRGGYAKRTRSDNYRAQRRGGKGVKGAQLRSDDVVEHFFVTTTHHWLLFFTNLGRVYRAKAYELPEAGRDAKGQHVANLLAFQPGEQIAQVLDIPDYEARAVPGAGHPRGPGEEDPAGGVRLQPLRRRDRDQPARRRRAGLRPAGRRRTPTSCWSPARACRVRFTADDTALRPMGRATSGVTGMKFRAGDRLLSMDVVHDDDAFVFVVTEGGWAKRTAARRVPGAGPRRSGHQGRQAQRGARRPGRRPWSSARTTRCSSSWSTARSSARPSPRCRPRAATRWVSSSPSRTTATGSSPSPATPSAASAATRTDDDEGESDDAPDDGATRRRGRRRPGGRRRSTRDGPSTCRRRGADRTRPDDDGRRRRGLSTDAGPASARS